MGSNNYQVVVANAFADDIEEAVTYYETQSGKKSAARFLEKYDSFLGLVSRLPGHGPLIGDSGLRWRQLGVFPIQSFDSAEFCCRSPGVGDREAVLHVSGDTADVARQFRRLPDAVPDHLTGHGIDRRKSFERALPGTGFPVFRGSGSRVGRAVEHGGSPVDIFPFAARAAEALQLDRDLIRSAVLLTAVTPFLSERNRDSWARVGDDVAGIIRAYDFSARYCSDVISENGLSAGEIFAILIAFFNFVL